MNKVRRNT